MPAPLLTSLYNIRAAPSRRSPGPAGTAGRVRRAAAELTPQAIEQIAQRVAELLGERGEHPGTGRERPTPARLLDATQLARHLGVTRTWVYEHADELGAVTLGDGPRPRLRFDPAIATAALHKRRQGPNTAGRRPAGEAPWPGRPRRRAPSTVPLLPVHQPGGRGILYRLADIRRSR
jgi:hypothetical protein